MSDTSRRQQPLPRLSARHLTTSVGRQRLPELLEASASDKAVVGMSRHKRAAGLLAPAEAARLLASLDEALPKHVRDELRDSVPAHVRQSIAQTAFAVNEEWLRQALEQAKVAGRAGVSDEIVSADDEE